MDFKFSPSLKGKKLAGRQGRLAHLPTPSHTHYTHTHSVGIYLTVYFVWLLASSRARSSPSPPATNSL